MIRSFKHKGLEDFFKTGSTTGIQPKHAPKLSLLLSALNKAEKVTDLSCPKGWDLHPLKGNLKGHWSLKVNGNWRMTFRFEQGDAYIVDYQDYH